MLVALLLKVLIHWSRYLDKNGQKAKAGAGWRPLGRDDPVGGQAPVVRKEIREMLPEEQKRFAEAVRKMMENSDGPGTSQYFRLASYHGGAGSAMDAHCVHGREAFPGWHRAYLLDFEQSMRAADRALGNDGNIGLPYWDWARSSINGEVYPKILRETFSTDLDESMFPEGVNHRRYSRLTGLKSDDALERELIRYTVGPDAQSVLNSTTHARHADATHLSTGQRKSLEDSHNMVHVAVGGIMGSVPTAAFHPIFWLHHCNVDRYYEGYIQLNPDSHDEYQARQAELQRTGQSRATGPGLPDGPYGIYHPFTHPLTGQPFHARDSFDTEALGYTYDDLPDADMDPSMHMTEAPTFVCFENIKISELIEKERSCTLFVFVHDKSKDWSPPESEDQYTEDPNFAGAGAIFGFSSGRCENCDTRPLFDVTVDITDTLQKLQLRRRDIEVKVKVRTQVDTDDGPSSETLWIEETRVPQPVVRGPLFDSNMPMQIGDDSNDPDDVKALQNFLVRNGYKDSDVVDGQVGSLTDKAIKKFQQANDLKVDGIVGDRTKQRILGTQFDAGKHIEPVDIEVGGGAAPFPAGSTVFWRLAPYIPGYLSSRAVVAELQAAFEVWQRPSGLRFVFTEDNQPDASLAITISFSIDDETDDPSKLPDKLYKYDGPGRILAKAEKGKSVVFDGEERWVLQDEIARRIAVEDGSDVADVTKPKEFCLLPVAVHEIGHVLGLVHSENPQDVMGPYYRADCVTPTAGDIKALQALYASSHP